MNNQLSSVKPFTKCSNCNKMNNLFIKPYNNNMNIIFEKLHYYYNKMVDYFLEPVYTIIICRRIIKE